MLIKFDLSDSFSASDLFDMTLHFQIHLIRFSFFNIESDDQEIVLIVFISSKRKNLAVTVIKKMYRKKRSL